ncbi:MAG: efflux RND transporter permease subunit [Vicinamibacterales bacterium]|nr:efflux RND transporter permease subunit [Vicinamibacterales bacterium]
MSITPHASGVAGRLAATFINSKLTPLFIVASMLLGVMAVIALPREEEPQIIVPMIDVIVEMPGATPAEVQQRVTRPLERLLWEVPGVEYLYSTSSPGRAMVIVRFLVGEDEEAALVRLNQKLQANAALVPPGASAPLVTLRAIDDVPVMALTLWGARYDDAALRLVAGQLAEGLKEVPDISEVTILGGRRREVRVELDPARLDAHGVDALQVAGALTRANARAAAATTTSDGLATRIETGLWLDSRAAIEQVVVRASANLRPLRVGDVATVDDADAEPTSYVRFHTRDEGTSPAVTLAIAKRKGTNAIDLTHRIEEKLALLRPTYVPADLTISVTRNYGETASEKSNELLFHMAIAVVSVSLLIWFALGRRESLVVATAIPVTLALTLFVFYLYGYTLNRITLFALIFSIGILVDDAIVVVENIVRHVRLGGGTMRTIAIRAVDEVGNPTILATLTVVAAILPMAFVGGLMGPYMRPIPVGATAAMLFSLVVAFIVTPWAAVRLLSTDAHGDHAHTEDRLTVLYRRVMARLLASPASRFGFLGSVAGLLVLAAALVPLGFVTVKMLPFDNKSEFQIIVNMPEGTPLESTARVAAALADAALEEPDVTSVQSYVGTASPYNFNGLVRRYFLRQEPHQADLQVLLRPKGDRDAQSHEVAGRVRTRLAPIAASFGARMQVAEVPPGPPVLQTLVAEIYGPDAERRLALATEVRALFLRTPGVVDVDWYVETPQPKRTLTVDGERAAAAGVTAADIAALVRMGGAGQSVGLLHDPAAREDVPVVLRLPRALRTPDALASLRLHGTHPVTVGAVTRPMETTEHRSLYAKNLQPVTYVTADMAGGSESPVYAILEMNRTLSAMTLDEGYDLEVFNAQLPTDSTRYAMKWDGEWHITLEVFRDLGLAFAAVLILIYILVVGWFQSFRTPITIMAAIPFSLVGILPAHAAMGAFFTATSMIGFIAGAGIVVRNSIILVDFIELRLKEGMTLADAVVDAGAVRFRPMALTAAAVIVGAGVILFDPIFQGLAISLMAGEVASLLLSRMAVPVLYFISASRDDAATVPADAVPALHS